MSNLTPVAVVVGYNKSFSLSEKGWIVDEQNLKTIHWSFFNSVLKESKGALTQDRVQKEACIEQCVFNQHEMKALYKKCIDRSVNRDALVAQKSPIEKRQLAWSKLYLKVGQTSHTDVYLTVPLDGSCKCTFEGLSESDYKIFKPRLSDSFVKAIATALCKIYWEGLEKDHRENQGIQTAPFKKLFAYPEFVAQDMWSNWRDKEYHDEEDYLSLKSNVHRLKKDEQLTDSTQGWLTAELESMEEAVIFPEGAAREGDNFIAEVEEIYTWVKQDIEHEVDDSEIDERNVKTWCRVQRELTDAYSGQLSVNKGVQSVVSTIIPFEKVKSVIITLSRMSDIWGINPKMAFHHWVMLVAVQENRESITGKYIPYRFIREK